MENSKNICPNCKKELEDSSLFCPNCGTKLTTAEKASTETSENRNLSFDSSNRDKAKEIMGKYHLSPATIIVVLGAIITFLGIYVFQFFDVSLPFFGHKGLTLAGSVKFIKQFLGVGASLGGDSSVINGANSVIHGLQFFISTMTILPIIVAICSFINKKSSKIVGSIAALLVTIVYFTFNAKFISTIASYADLTDYTKSLFGPAGSLIIVGLLLMLGGSCYSLYRIFKNNDENIPFNFSAHFSKITKKQKLISGGVIALILIIFGLFTMINNMQKSVMSDVKVEFSGYNHQGKAVLSGNYDKKISDIMNKKRNMSASDISVELNKTSELSNGDKVTVKISSTLDKSPIKPETKTFTVSGLEKTTSYTIDSLLKSTKFIGFNHYGKVDYDESLFDMDDKNLNLSNGDEITLNLSQGYIEQESDNGKILKGKTSKTLVVSGLKDSAQISNLNDFLNQTDSVARDDNQSNAFSTYTVTRQDSYFIGENVKISLFDDNVDSTKQFSVVTIYKIDEKSDDKVQPSKYRVYGYSGLTLKNGKIDVSSLKNENQYLDYHDFNSVQEVLDSLKVSYPGISKIN